jgi:hypothetical protein
MNKKYLTRRELLNVENRSEEAGAKISLYDRIKKEKPGVLGHLATTVGYMAIINHALRYFEIPKSVRNMIEYAELGVKEGLDQIQGGPGGYRSALDLEEVLERERIILEKNKMELEEIVERKKESLEILSVGEAKKYIGPKGEGEYVINAMLEVNRAYVDANARYIQEHLEKETALRKAERLFTHGMGTWQNYKDTVRKIPGLSKIEKFFNRFGANGFAEKVENSENLKSEFYNIALEFYKDRAVGNNTSEQLIDDIKEKRASMEVILERMKKIVGDEKRELLAHEIKLVEHVREVTKQLGTTYGTEDSLFDVQRKLLVYNGDLVDREKISKHLESDWELVGRLEKKVDDHKKVVEETREKVGRDVELEEYNPVSLTYGIPMALAVIGGLGFKLASRSKFVKPIDNTLGIVAKNIIKLPYAGAKKLTMGLGKGIKNTWSGERVKKIRKNGNFKNNNSEEL